MNTQAQYFHYNLAVRGDQDSLEQNDLALLAIFFSCSDILSTGDEA